MKNVFCRLIPFFLILSGCEKIMHPEEFSPGKITNYHELTSAVAGVYGELANSMKYYSNINLKGDDLNSQISSTNIDVCTRDAYSLDGSISWEYLYKTIVSANNILVQYDTISSLDNQTAKILAEIYFIRAYCYFRLTRLFGQIPLITDIEIKYNVPPSTYSEIYLFIEKDLQLALNYLPKNNLDARIPFSTPHRGVVKALLAEFYLNWAGYPAKNTGKYMNAAKVAKELIDSSHYFGFRLMDNYAHVWDSSHFYNEESVFSIYYSNTANYNSFYFEGCYFYGEVGLRTIELSYFLTYQPIRNIEVKRFPQVEVKFYNDYPNSYRKDVTFYKRIFVTDFRYQNPPVGRNIVMDTIDLCYFMGYRKFFYSPRLIHKDQLYDDYNTFYYAGSPKVYIYRYAQTLLTYAESKARSGQLDNSAYEAVNMIRRRAHNVDIYSPSIYDLQYGLSADMFADSVVSERAWELCGEPEGRWFDLVRLEKVEELPTIRDAYEGGPPQYPITKEDDYFFPVPQEDVFLNPSLK